ncbi:interferon regulatory factor 9-like [Corvus moneduloides]|uniref:interferon regulatory factor 9-like n=1 Tax=Corvus moneduloides TaxID=1196302 RepID=UPI00136342CB|nr:interferon regulatory factor 9-like [Corvus moneduloides]
MAEGGPRRLRPWLLEQLKSGRFPGLVWDDEAQSALRIPWAHGGRNGAKGGAGAALCKAWAEYKGRVRPGDPPDPAGWKTRLRCALARSPEFRAVPGRSRSDGPCPYRVYRLLPAREPKPSKAQQSQKEAGPSPAEPLPPTPPPETQEGAQDDEDPAEAPPPEVPPLRIQVESPEPLPPAQGDSALLLRLRHGPALAWQGALPPGEYLLSPPGRQGAPPPPLPRLVLPAGAGLGRGLLLSSAPRGLFLRMRPGAAPAAGTVRGPHAPHGPLQQGALLQPFDARRFREEVELHRAGRGPRPPHRVTLELGPPDGAPQGGGLVLELEQAFAQRLLDTPETPPDPFGTPPGQ